LQEEGALRDESNIFPQHVKANIFGIHSVNLHGAFTQVAQSKEGLEDGTFACASSTNDANFHSRLSFEAQLLQARF